MALWYRLITLGKLTPQDYRFEANLGYNGKLYLQKRGDGREGRSDMKGTEKSELSHRCTAMYDRSTNDLYSWPHS